MKNKLLVFFIILLSILALACKNEKASPEKQKIKVQAQPIKTVLISEKVYTIGRLTRKSEVKLAFKTPGIIRQINAQEGDYVKKGDVLASLDLTELKSMKSQAELAFNKAKRDFERASNLFNDSVATLEQFQNAKSAMEAAKAQLDIANFNLQFSVINAPNDGRILKKLAEPNEIISAGYPVFLFSSSEEAWVLRVNVIDKDLKKLEIGDSALISFNSIPNKKFSAFVSEIGSFADPYTATFEIELQIDNPPDNLASGMIAKAEIISKMQVKYQSIPPSAMLEANNSMAEIYLFNGDSVFKRNVKLAMIKADMLLLAEELDSNLFVLTKGVHYIKADSEIEVEIINN
jgi:RND family efflux transporter MFP subunit